MTAKVLIRLAARIETEVLGDASPPSEDEVYGTPPEQGGTFDHIPSPYHTMMPHGESGFWQIYGNKLRVNGTVEETCVIR